MKNLDRSLKSFPYNIINHTSDSKQGHTPENTFQLQRVTENSIGNVVSSQLASLKDLIKNKIKKSTGLTTLLVTQIFVGGKLYVTDRLLLTDNL